MLIKSFIAALATATLAVKLIQHLSNRNQLRRVRDDHRKHHDDVTRWEGEGGNLPPSPPVSL